MERVDDSKTLTKFSGTVEAVAMNSELNLGKYVVNPYEPPSVEECRGPSNQGESQGDIVTAVVMKAGAAVQLLLLAFVVYHRPPRTAGDWFVVVGGLLIGTFEFAIGYALAYHAARNRVERE